MYPDIWYLMDDMNLTSLVNARNTSWLNVLLLLLLYTFKITY